MEKGNKAEWPNCEVCGQPVTTKTGMIGVSYSDRKRYEDERAEFEIKHPPQEDGLMYLGPDWPDQIHWCWGHEKCLPSDLSYWMEADRLDSYEKALGWTIHLMEKKWFQHTDWTQVIRHFYPCDNTSHSLPNGKKQRTPLSVRRRFQILSRDHFRCKYCGREAKDTVLEVDHIVPISKGGTDAEDNLTTSCQECNRSKRAETIVGFDNQ